MLELLKKILGCLEDIKAKMPDCEDGGCPELVEGAAEFITDSANGTTGSAVQFPVTTPPNETSDIGVPVALPQDMDCEIPDDAPMVVRWCFDHSIDASSNHTGFNVSANDGTATVGTIVGQSNGSTSVDVGPGFTPHDGPRAKYWVDIEFTAAQLKAGVVLQTSAFGTITTETETIHSQDAFLTTDLAEFGCC